MTMIFKLQFCILISGFKINKINYKTIIFVNKTQNTIDKNMFKFIVKNISLT